MAHTYDFVSPHQVFQPPPAPPSNESPAPTKRPRGKAAKQQQDGNEVPAVKVKRKRTDTHERKQAHNQMEKERRLVLNGQFLDLAKLLPTLAEVKRPSKGQIIVNATARINQQRESRLLAAREVRALLQHRNALLIQINQMRADLGLDGMSIPKEESESVRRVLAVEDEVFGKFEAGLLGGDGEEEEEASPTVEMMVESRVSFSHQASSSSGHPSFRFNSSSIADLIGQPLHQDRSPLSNTSANSHFSQAAFVPSFVSDLEHVYDSPISDTSISSSFSHSPPLPHSFPDEHIHVGAPNSLGSASGQFASWADGGFLDDIQKKASGMEQRGGGGREGIGSIEGLLNPDPAQSLSRMPQQRPASFSAQFGSKLDVSSKQYPIPPTIPPEQHFQSYCFPPSDPHPLPSLVSSLSGSYSPSPANLDSLAVKTWRDLGLGQQQHNANSNRLNGLIQSNANRPSIPSFSRLSEQLPRPRHAAQLAPEREEHREPTMEELREAVRIGMDYGVSLAAAAAARGGRNGGGGAAHNPSWGFNARHQ